MPATRHYTAADLADTPDDGQRYEVLRGELLVSPAPSVRHQQIVGRLFGALLHYLEPHGLVDQLLMAPLDITFNDDTVLEPDLLVADTAAALRSGLSPDIVELFLVIETISPSTARNDRILKRPVYQERGIPQYWIVDGEQRQVEVWTPEASAPVVERQHVAWRHPLIEDECVVDLVRLFNFG